MRYAFLTTEFPTTKATSGGLANYTRRMAQALSDYGYEVEVFVANKQRSDTTTEQGYCVHHVDISKSSFFSIRDRILRKLGFGRFVYRFDLLRASKQVVESFESRHTEMPFNIVQSSDHLGIGSMLSQKPDRVHVVRCSSAAELWLSANEKSNVEALEAISLEEKSIRNADVVISPSQLVAAHYEKKLGRSVRVVRPPAFVEAEPDTEGPSWLPKKYLLHFSGILSRRKGVNTIVEALALATRQRPGITMLMIGATNMAFMAPLRKQLPGDGRNLLVTFPMQKPLLYSVIQRAQAVVLPSLVDNIPNTALESLIFGAPVIFTRGASLDEMVSEGPGVSLVNQGDVDGLAEAMVAAWDGEIGTRDEPWLQSLQGREYVTTAAIEHHLSVIEENMRP